MHMTTRVWTCSYWTTILILQALVSLSGKAQCAPQHSDAVEGRVQEEATEDGQHQQERSSDIYQRLAKLGDLLNAYDTDDKLADIVDPGQESKRDTEDLGSDGNLMWFGPRVGKAKRDIGLGEGGDSSDVWFGPRLGKRAESWFGPRLGKREWYGPRLGKRAGHVESYYDDEQENLDIEQLIDDMKNKRTPVDSIASSTNRQWWGPVARRSPFVPRLGKRGDEENLEVEDSSDYFINLATRAAFSPRLGKKNLSFAPRLGKKAAAFSPRLGKKSVGFAPRLGKRQTAFAPRLGKRAGLAFAPRLGRSDKSFDFSESDKRSAFSPRLGRSPAFAPRLGRAAFSPRLG